MSLDDGIEIFGGTVDLSHVLITRAGDDGLDWDYGWRGRAQFLVVQQDATDGDHAIEADNHPTAPESYPRSAPTLFNVTLVGSADDRVSQRGILMRNGTAGALHNVLATGFTAELLDVRDLATVTQAWRGRLSISPMGAWGIGADGSRWATDERSANPNDADYDDDGGFDERDWIYAQTGNVLGDNPGLSPRVLDVINPDFVPLGDDARRGAVVPPEGDFFDQSAVFRGAFVPDEMETWYERWTTLDPS
jgi:hypothetical protein